MSFANLSHALAEPSDLVGIPAFRRHALPNHPTWLAFLRLEDTHWPNHPVRFFSALSLEKNAPSDSA
jgi:hypothetical protein